MPQHLFYLLREWWRGCFAPRSLGQRGEALARRHLKRLGYKIVGGGERDFLGELDLVAVEARTVVFVEVKTRATHDAGHPAEAVDAEKQRRLTRLALSYLRRHGLLNHAARFDVVAITWPDGAKEPRLEHIQNAFAASGQASMFS
jgi:putative endonuclease